MNRSHSCIKSEEDIIELFNADDSESKSKIFLVINHFNNTFAYTIKAVNSPTVD